MDQSDRVRMTCGAATGLAGGVVAWAMSGSGGSLARFLPDGPWFHIAALLGAGVAGLALADGFGRKGWLGAGAALAAAPVATGIGAALGAAGLMVVFAAVQFLAGAGGVAPGSVTGAPALGVLAVVDGIGTSPVVALTWVSAMCAVHLAMRRLRNAFEPG